MTGYLNSSGKYTQLEILWENGHNTVSRPSKLRGKYQLQSKVRGKGQTRCEIARVLVKPGNASKSELSLVAYPQVILRELEFNHSSLERLSQSDRVFCKDCSHSAEQTTG